MLSMPLDAMWLPWVCVFPALLLLLARQTVLAFVLLAVGVALAFVIGQLDARSLLTGLVLGASAWLVRGNSRTLRIVAVIVFVSTAVALRAHVLPGFNNLLVLDARLSAEAPMYRMYLNWDKLLIIVWLVYAWRKLDWSTDVRTVLSEGMGWGLATAMLCICIGFSFGVVHWDPKLPAASGVWLLDNLVLVCLGEELLFRGFVQSGLARVWQRHRHGAWAALIFASALFGLVHLPDGMGYAAVSVLAGLGYGLAHQRGGLQAAVLAHAVLNIAHFFLFTYPHVR